MAGAGRYWYGAAVLAAAAGVALALWRAPHSVQVPSALDEGTGHAPSSAASQPAPRPAPPLLARSASVPPPGLDAGRWLALQHELASRPAERQRLADH